MMLRKPSKQQLEALAHAMRQFAAQANALAYVLEKAETENVIYSGDIQVSCSIPREDFTDGAVVSRSPSPSELSFTLEGNVHIRLTGAAAEMADPQSYAMKAERHGGA